MGFLWFLLVGVIAGWLAGNIYKGKSFGIIGNMIVGVIGAFLGGFVFSLVGMASYGLLGSIISATVGALIFLWLLRLIKA